MTIRQVTPADLPELVVLCAEHAAYERSAFDPVGKEAALHTMFFALGGRLHGFVVDSGHQLEGYATYAVECSTWDASYYMHMDCLFLRPEVRNQGVGRQLMRAIAQKALEQGITRMQWQTPSFNVDAVRFYDRMRPVKKEKYRMFLDETATRVLAGVHDR